MAEEFQWGNCGGRNWWDSLRILFFSPKVNDLVSLRRPLNHERSITANPVGDHDSAGSDSDGIASILPMRRIRLSSSPTTEDWNRDLLHDSGRSEKNYSHMPSTDFFDDSSINSFKKVNDQSFNPLDQHHQPSNSFTNLPLNSASCNHTSSLLQTLFDTDSQPQQSLLGNLQPPNYPMNSDEILPSLPMANHLQFTNNTHLWNATVEASGDAPEESQNLDAAMEEEEELGDPITALHQMIAPFGKTDTASVLYETIGYIKFLNNQISVLSSPYSKNGGGPSMQHQQTTDEIIKNEERLIQDLKSKGLCLVPISTTFSSSC